MLLDPHVANLNTGSFGPLPRPVFDRVTALRRRLAEEPMDFLIRQAPPLLREARSQFASFLGADPRRLVFTANVTASINTVAAALRLSAPGEILLTDHEYGAMHWCWERAAQRQGLTLRIAELPHSPADPGEIVDAIKGALSDRTRLLFFSHVLSPTGMVLPAKELCDVARRRGILTMIDGAHAPAMIPLDLSSLACDFYGGNCHKWLLAPTGSGFLYFGEGAERLVQPLQVSWGWHHEGQPADDPDEFGSTPLIRSFEFEGTRDPCPWLTVPTAIAFQERLGWASIRASQFKPHRSLMPPSSIRTRPGACHTRPPAAPRLPHSVPASAWHQPAEATTMSVGNVPDRSAHHRTAEYHAYSGILAFLQYDGRD